MIEFDTQILSKGLITVFQNLDAYKLKWIAIIGMILNHVTIALREVIPFWLQFPLYAVGGLTFPIMAFFVVEGYRHTSNLKRYMLRIFIFGLIAQIPYMMAFRAFALNIMFTIFLGLLVIYLYDNMKKRPLFWVIFSFSLLISLLFDWAILGPLMIFMYRTIKKESSRTIWPGLMAGIAYTILSLLGVAGLILSQNMPGMEGLSETIRQTLPSLVFGLGCFAAVLLLRKFNGERGKSMKYLFYVAYPLHLAILAAIAIALGLITFALPLPSFGFML